MTAVAELVPAVDWLALLLHFGLLSLLSVGGAISTAPDMHRYLVAQQGWLSDGQFSAAIAIAQAAPGPNVLFVGLLGWSIGLNAAGAPPYGWHDYALALLGLGLAMLGMVLPSSLLTLTVTRWAQRHHHWRGVRAFKAGMAPLVVALVLATGWLLASAHRQPARDWPLWLLSACAAALVWRTRVHLLWLIGAGGALGALGLV